MNDKAIDDALENAVSECLKSLQKTNPGLLLNANQLKRLERDAKYVPAIASAISFVICHSRRRHFHGDSLEAIFGWNGDGNPGDRLLSGEEEPEGRVEVGGGERELQAIRLSLQRRLRFVVSDEVKREREEEERERKRTERSEILAERVRVQSKKKEILDATMSDCLQSCTSSESSTSSKGGIERISPMGVQPSDSFESEDSSDESFSENHYVDRGTQCHLHLSTVDTEDTAALTDEDEWV